VARAPGRVRRDAATPVQVALAWLLDLAPNILLIPGTRTHAHLAEDLGAADVRLDAVARAELAGVDIVVDGGTKVR